MPLHCIVISICNRQGHKGLVLLEVLLLFSRNVICADNIVSLLRTVSCTSEIYAYTGFFPECRVVKLSIYNQYGFMKASLSFFNQSKTLRKVKHCFTAL